MRSARPLSGAAAAVLLLAVLAGGAPWTDHITSLPTIALAAEVSSADGGDSEPLDLDIGDISLDDLKAEAKKANPMAGCVMCHIDAGDAFKKSRHALEEIGCTDCHGPSKGHVADENNEVKPDEIFARKNVDAVCGDCHECGRPPEAPSPRRRRPRPAAVCIDCHGSHALTLTPPAAPHRRGALRLRFLGRGVRHRPCGSR